MKNLLCYANVMSEDANPPVRKFKTYKQKERNEDGFEKAKNTREKRDQRQQRDHKRQMWGEE